MHNETMQATDDHFSAYFPLKDTYIAAFPEQNSHVNEFSMQRPQEQFLYWMKTGAMFFQLLL
jgi:hypothetical protein